MKNGLICHAQLARLFRMALEIQSGSYPRAEDLADMCGVSRRTAYRDLETLVRAGVPIQYRADRMGYELEPGFWMAPPQVSEDEIRALVARLQVGDMSFPAPVRRNAQTGLVKFVEALPQSSRILSRALLAGLVDRRVSDEASESSARVFSAILGALSRGRQVRLDYRPRSRTASDAAGGISTKLHPYRLVRHERGWSLVGRSSLHRGLRAFWLDRIVRAVELDDESEQPARAHRARQDPLAV